MANHDMTNPLDDRVATGIDAAAADIDVGNASAMLADVRAMVSRRRRRRRHVVVGVAAVAALGATGLVVANFADSNGDHLIVSAPATEPAVSPDAQPEDTIAVEATVAADETIAAPPSGDAPLVVTPTRSETVTDSGFAIEQGVSNGGIELFAWKDGFLALRQDPLPQPLPAELPPEIAAQFPQEVQDFFADGLPATIEEATALLEEAGLFDEVSQVVLNNPDVYNAIYGEPTAFVTTVRFSPDGIEWVDADITFPTPNAAWLNRQSTGDRLVMVTSTREDGVGRGPKFSTTTSVSVWSTTDLVNWDEQIVPLPQRPADLPDFVWFDVFPNALAATDSGWIVNIATSTEVDLSSFLDDETRDRADAGFSNSYPTGTGVAIDLYDLDGPANPETIEFTWAELGLDGPQESTGSSSTVGADWGGEVVALAAPDRSGSGSPQMFGTEFGFVALGDGLYVSDDGSSWTSVEVADAALQYIEWAVETEGGLLFSAHDGSGSLRFLYDHESGSTSIVDVPGLPEQLSSNGFGQRHVLLSDFNFGDGGEGGLAEFVTIHSIASAEVDGYRFELEVTADDESGTSTYTLTDVGSGEVVSTETLSISYASSVEPDGFRFVVEANDIGEEQRGGFRVLDPETGDELIAVPFESMTTTFLDENGDVIEGAGDDDVLDPNEAGVQYDEHRPDQYVVASTASGLIVQQINDTDRIEDEVLDVAVSGDVVLTAGWLGTFTRITPDT